MCLFVSPILINNNAVTLLILTLSHIVFQRLPSKLQSTRRFLSHRSYSAALARCPTANQSQGGQEPCLLCQWWRMFGMSKGAQDEAKKEQKNKNFTTKSKKKTPKQSKQLSYIIYLPPCWILAPTWLLYDTRDPRPCQECDRGSEWHRVCVCVLGVVLCPAVAEQNRTSVGCSQTRSERKMENRGGEAESVADVLRAHWPVLFHRNRNKL